MFTWLCNKIFIIGRRPTHFLLWSDVFWLKWIFLCDPVAPLSDISIFKEMDNGCIHSWAAPCITIHFLQYWKGINQMSEPLRKIWSLNTCASGRWSSGEQADVGHSTLHTLHSTLQRGKEGHSIATCGHKLSGSQRCFSHYPKKLTWNTLKTTSNQYSLGNIDNPEKARQSQHIQAQDLRKHRVRNTHILKDIF